MRNRSTTRRKCLVIGGTASLSLLAGCSNQETGVSEDSSEENNDDDTTESTDSDTGEMTELQSVTSIEDYYDSQYVSFDGNSASQTETWQHPGGIMVVDGDIEDSFQINLVDENGDSEFQLSSNIGQSRIWCLAIEEGTYSFDVDTEGSWSVAAARPDPPASAVQTPPATSSGTETDIIGPIDFGGSFTATATFTVDSGTVPTFVATAFPNNATSRGDTETLFSERETFENQETEASISSTTWIYIQSSGEWEFVFE